MQDPTHGHAAPDGTSQTQPGAASHAGTEPSSIARFSRIMEIVLSIVLVLAPIGLGVFAFGFSEQFSENKMLGQLETSPGPLDFPWTLAAFVVLLVVSAPVLYAANAARLMFRQFRFGTIFTPATAARVRQIALGLLAQVFVSTLGSLALSAVLSGAGKAEGLVLSISSEQIWIALFALIFLGLARVMHAAAFLAEDNASIV